MNKMLNELEHMIKEFDNVEEYKGYANHGTWHMVLWSVNDDDVEKKVIKHLKDEGDFTEESAKAFIESVFKKYPFDWKQVAEGLNAT